MVQDTMSPEIYLATVQDKGGRLLGGWGVADTMTIERPEDEVVDDYSNLKERFVLWVVSVPGESEWLRDVSCGKPRFGATFLFLTIVNYHDRIYPQVSFILISNSVVVLTLFLTPENASASARPHKYPLNSTHLGLQVKVRRVLTFLRLCSGLFLDVYSSQA